MGRETYSRGIPLGSSAGARDMQPHVFMVRVARIAHLLHALDLNRGEMIKFRHDDFQNNFR
jgi:hypothetical protein